MNEIKFMQRAIFLALQGLGSVSPNPVVGAVLVYDGFIIGEGYHMSYGEAHAEVNAIGSVLDKSLLIDATLYVTLEPCSHWGKTPPCVDIILEHKIGRVIIGTLDPYCEVSGNGIKRLIEAGVEVSIGVLEGECRAINSPFFTFHNNKRPYIILKWAETSDSFVDRVRDQSSSPVWFTGRDAKILVHKWRSEVDAIMVGRRTVALDNPELTVRDYYGRNPIRLTFDKSLVLDINSHIFNSLSKTILFTDINTFSLAKEKFSHNPSVLLEPLDYSNATIPQLLNFLYVNNIQSLFIEGGTTLLNSFIEAGYWDEARIFKSNKPLSAYYDKVAKGVDAPFIEGSLVSSLSLSNSSLSIFRCAGQ